VTSYFSTYSSTEYDRTPLDGPSEQERACVLPERGSRCLATSYKCFTEDCVDTDDEHDDSDLIHDSPLSSPTLISSDDAFPHSIHDFSADSIVLHTPPNEADEAEVDNDSETEVEDEHDEHDENREWEECMERRRMMFAQMCNRDESDKDQNPGCEVYRSVAERVAELLKSVGCGVEVAGTSTPPTSNSDTPLSVENLKIVSGSSGHGEKTPSLMSISEETEEGETEVIVSPAFVEGGREEMECIAKKVVRSVMDGLGM